MLDDVLVKPKFENPDFWFPEFNVYAELKCLSEDLISDKQFQDTVRDMITKWTREGKVRFGRGEYRPLSALPKECQEELFQRLKRKVERVVAKANSQVKSAKAELGHPDASGMLILVNDGNMLMQPGMLVGLISRCVSNPNQFTSLQSVILATINETVSTPDRRGNNWMWLHGPILDREDGGRSEALARKLGDVVPTLHGKLTGLNMTTVDLEPTRENVNSLTMHQHAQGPIPTSSRVPK